MVLLIGGIPNGLFCPINRVKTAHVCDPPPNRRTMPPVAAFLVSLCSPKCRDCPLAAPFDTTILLSQDVTHSVRDRWCLRGFPRSAAQPSAGGRTQTGQARLVAPSRGQSRHRRDGGRADRYAGSPAHAARCDVSLSRPSRLWRVQ